MDFDPTNIEHLKKVFATFKKTQNPSQLKKLGQNFLIDPIARDEIIKVVDLRIQDQVLEIGPGAGVLTQKIVKKVKRVVAIDIDPYLLEITRLATQSSRNLELRLEDIRKVNLPKLFKNTDDYIVISNVPYYLTAYLLQLLTTSTCSPRRIILTIQKEVAQRIAADPGKHSILSISVQNFGSVKIVRNILRNSFWPAPKVDSAVIKIERYNKPLINISDQKDFFRVVKAGFSARRKKLINALSAGLKIDQKQIKNILAACGIDQNARAQELSHKNWAQISQKIKIIK